MPAAAAPRWQQQFRGSTIFLAAAREGMLGGQWRRGRANEGQSNSLSAMASITLCCR